MKLTRLAVLDLETDPFEPGKKVQPFVSGYYDGSKFVSIWDNEPKTCISRTFAALQTEEPSLIYIHNGGRFDVFYFLDYVTGNLRIIHNRIVSCKLGVHELRDSYAIMPFPLSAYNKDKIDYNKMHRSIRETHREEIVSYLRSDCIYLFDLVKTFHAEFQDKLTIGSAALKQLKSFHTFACGGAEFDTRIRRDFYHGGRNQCFRTGMIYEKATIYDVNSMYPYVMRNMLHPISIGIEVSKRIQDDTCFVVCTGRNYGAFPVRSTATGGGLDFTSKAGTYSTTIHEFRAAVETGCFEPTKIIKTYGFKSRITFAEFVDHFFDERRKAKLAGDKARDLLYKFTLNSAYGKFAQNPENFYDYQLTNSRSEIPRDPCSHCKGTGKHPAGCHMCWRLNHGIDPVWSDDNGVPSSCDWWCGFCNGSGVKWSYAEGNDEYTIWQARPKMAYFNNVATGASITGAARSVLLRGIACANRPIYCDTDSIIAPSVRGLALSSSELGAWKVEAVCDVLAIAGKKLYVAFSYVPSGDESQEHCKLPNGHVGWVVKKAHKGVRLSAADIVRITCGDTVEYANPVPSYRLDGSVSWINRKVKRTAK